MRSDLSLLLSNISSRVLKSVDVSAHQEAIENNSSQHKNLKSTFQKFTYSCLS